MKEAEEKILPVFDFGGRIQEKYKEVSGDVGRRGSIYQSNRRPKVPSIRALVTHHRYLKVLLLRLPLLPQF